MRLGIASIVGCLAVSTGVAGVHAAGQEPLQSSGTPATVPAQQAFVTQYCVTCHNQQTRSGELTLDAVDVTNVGADAETWEKVVRKLRTRAMPPPGRRRPGASLLQGFAPGHSIA